MKNDIYQSVTDEVIRQIEQGAPPWAKPWAGGASMAMPRRATGEFYKGINVLLLWSSASRNGYAGDQWFTYKQAQAVGGQVRKGEKATTVVYAGAIEKDDGDKLNKVFFMRGYAVFNRDQIDGFCPLPVAAPVTPGEYGEINLASETYFQNTGAIIRHGGNRAFYNRAGDFIMLPDAGQFTEAAHYTATKAHEVVHWTSAESRCNRELGKRFGDNAYAVEELIAEMGAAFLCASLGIDCQPRIDHASYLASWLKILKADKRAIFTAASAAQKAVTFLDGLQETPLAIAS